MEYETITDGLNYYIGGLNQVPLSNAGELIRKLSSYGPYQTPTFRYNKIALIYLNQENWKSVVEEIKTQISHKLSNILHISNINISEFTYNSSDFDSIESHINNAIEMGIDGIMLILPGYMPSVYYKLKSYLINNIPSQFMNYHVLTNRILPYNQLDFYTGNLLVQFISKLGGKPWILKVDPERGSDIIIGAGATRVDNENLFCFAMVFKKDGTMLWNEISPIIRREQYLTYLKKTIKKVVKGFRENNPEWPVESLTLHISGKRLKIKDGETKVLEDTIEELKGQDPILSQDVKFAILHLNETHPYWIMGDSDNRYHPYEGTKVKLSSKRYLLALSQPSQRRDRLEMVTPIKPLSVEIVSHNWTSEEFYPSANEVLNEIYYLSKMNWRGFRGRNLPVTINYPKLVAKIIANINRYGGYQINTEGNRLLQTIPWFL